MKQTNAIAVVIDPEVPDWWPQYLYAMAAGEPVGNMLVLWRPGHLVVIEPAAPGDKTKWTVAIRTVSDRQLATAVIELSIRELMDAFALKGPYGQIGMAPEGIDVEIPGFFRRWENFLAFDSPAAGAPPVTVFITEDIQLKLWRTINN